MSRPGTNSKTSTTVQTGITIKDVARQAGVSVGTVSNVLSGRGSVKLVSRERVERAIADLGYKPNRLAASLRQKRTRTVGLIIPNIRNAFFIDLADMLDDLARKDGFELVIQTSREDPGRTIEHIRTLASRRVEGLLAIPTVQPQDALAELSATGLPVVLVDRLEEESAFPTVALENRGAGALATRHLIDLGHRRIAFVINTPDLTNGRHRIEGFQSTVRDAGIADTCETVFCGIERDLAYERIRGLLAHEYRPTALIAVTNLAVVGALHAIDEAGLKIPDDISLLAFDDSDLLTVVRPAISAIRQPIEAISVEAWRLMKAAIEGETMTRQIRLDATMVVRQSTAPPPR